MGLEQNLGTCQVFLQAASPAWWDRAQALAEELGIPLISVFTGQDFPKDTPPSEDSLLLKVAEGLELQTQEGLSFSIDFDLDHIHYKQKQVGRKNLLARALGIDKGIERVLDLSCGFARDSVLLAQLGFRVRAVERNKVLWKMLMEAQNLSEQAHIKSIEFIKAESLDFMLSLSEEELQIQSLYFDPMFPETKKDALPKKEMQIFRRLVGHDQDAAGVVEQAAKLKVARLVVKRPMKAKALYQEPRYCLEGKLIRYDVYQF